MRRLDFFSARWVPALALDVGRTCLPFAKSAAILTPADGAVATGMGALLGVSHVDSPDLFDLNMGQTLSSFYSPNFSNSPSNVSDGMAWSARGMSGYAIAPA